MCSLGYNIIITERWLITLVLNCYLRTARADNFARKLPRITVVKMDHYCGNGNKRERWYPFALSSISKESCHKKKNLSSQGFENDGAKFKKDVATPVAVLLHTFTYTRLIPWILEGSRDIEHLSYGIYTVNVSPLCRLRLTMLNRGRHIHRRNAITDCHKSYNTLSF